MDINQTIDDISQDDSDETYIFKLFVTGASPNSTRAVSNIKQICDSYLTGRYELEIVDVYQQKVMAESEQIIALPLLIKNIPYLKED